MSIAIFLLIISVSLIFISIGSYFEKERYMKKAMHLKAIKWFNLEFWTGGFGILLLMFSAVMFLGCMGII